MYITGLPYPTVFFFSFLVYQEIISFRSFFHFTSPEEIFALIANCVLFFTFKKFATFSLFNRQEENIEDQVQSIRNPASDYYNIGNSLS
jgi:uncharacterized membrane protein